MSEIFCYYVAFFHSKQFQLLAWRFWWLWLTIGEDLHLAELFVGNTKYPDVAQLRHKRLHSLDMDFGIFSTWAMAKIDRELKHGKAIGHDAFPKQGVSFSFFLRIRRQIEKNQHPHDSILAKPIHHSLHFRIHYLSQLSRKTLCQRSRCLRDCQHQRTSLSVNLNLFNWNDQQLFFYFSSQFIAVNATTNYSCHNLIHLRPVWFHNIIRQAIGVVPIMMMDSQCG